MNQIPFPAELRGTHKFVKWANQLLRACKANRHLMGDHTGLTETPMGMFRLQSARTGKGGGNLIEQVAIISVDGETATTLTCERSSGESVEVEKPLNLTTHASPRTRSITFNGFTRPIKEFIEPPYVINDRILVCKVGDTWFDLNVDARNWFPEYTVDEVCLPNGSPGRQAIAGGTAS